tara:strand:- start:464 stop:1441 length:978 start_codon:yes stop_codon:yes gene_type:complete
MVIEPTYGTSIKFVFNGGVWQSSDRYFKAMPHGVNNVVAELDLKFECDQDDLIALREEFKEKDGVSQLTFACPLYNFYKDFSFFGDSMSVESKSGDLFSVVIKGASTMTSPFCSDRGQFVDFSTAFDRTEPFSTSRLQIITGELGVDVIQVATHNSVYYYYSYNNPDNIKASSHSFWDKVWFTGDDFWENEGEYAVLSSQEDLESKLTQSLPRNVRKKMSINTTSSAFRIDGDSSFKTRIKNGINQTAWDGLELSFEGLSDAEAFILACFCEARLGYRGFDFSLPEPYDKCSSYLVLSWTHDIVDFQVNTIKIEIQPRFRSYKKC